MSTLGRAAARLLKRTLNRQGFELKRYRADFHYAPDYYGRSFESRSDVRAIPIFGELAKQTIEDGRSCLYYDRLYVLYQAVVNLMRITGSAEPMRLVEVGVYKGGTTAYLASLVEALGARAQIHSFDTFEGHPAADVDSGIDTFHRPGDFDDTSYEAVSTYLAGHANVTLYKGRFADQCEHLGSEPIAFMHLDVDLYGPTLHGLQFAHDRLIPGGIVVVDDYEVRTCPGVRAAIDEFLRAHPAYISVHPLTEQCVLTKVSAS